MQLAQVNIARAKGPLDGPIMAGFVARLDEINAIADRSPGFVWRLQDDAGNATTIRAFEEESIIVNLSVWESIEALKAYAYHSAHVELLRDRSRWFEKFEGAYLALWWVPAGHRPSVGEAKERLAQLEANGPSALAFTFREPFPPPG